MNIQDSLLSNGEKIMLALRELYHSHGYRYYRMSKFEEYDFYARNKDFLVSDNVITFTDTDGTLMAMKPDVTLSIVKNRKDDPLQTEKVYYVENVYRVAKGTNSFREIMQTGLECLGRVGPEEVTEVLTLAAMSLQKLSSDPVLVVSSMDVLEDLIAGAGVMPAERDALFGAIGEKNLHGLEEICTSAGVPDNIIRDLKELLQLHGTIDQALPVLKALGENPGCKPFLQVLQALGQTPCADRIRVDFSVVDDIHYYNGLVFKGFVSGVPSAVLSGGQYDRLMQKMQKRSRAIGFAVYTDLLDRLDLPSPEEASSSEQSDGYLNVALPKGRLGEKVYAMFAEAGYECPSILEQNRKLIFENPEKKIRYFWVKPSDVAIYVERGAADIGVAGKDILLEYEPDVYELLDLKVGKCRMAVAAPRGFLDDGTGTLRIATKFSSIAKKYYQSLGRDIDIIHLNGSIELAPILGLSDVIVDIVETGTTLRENNLEVINQIVPISARVIANQTAYKFKSARIQNVVDGLAGIVEGKT